MVEQCVLIAVATLLVLIVVYFASSYSSLELNEYGLDYSGIWKTVEPEPYTSGFHFLGFQHSFIVFPKSVQTIDFTDGGESEIIQSRTSDGLEVLLEVSFQYELLKASLYKLYMNYGTEYENIMILVTIDVINKVSNNYTAYDFFVYRSEISGVMEKTLKDRLTSDMGVNIKFFQLKDVDLPDSFEEAIQATEVKKQDIEKAKAEKSKAEIEIETKVQKAQQNREIILNKAYGESNSTTYASYGEVKSFNVTESTKIEAYTDLKETSGFTNEQLLNFIKSNIIASYTGDHLIISL